MRRIKLILAVAAAMAVMVLAAAPAMADGIHNSGNDVTFHDSGGRGFTTFITTTNFDFDSGLADINPGGFTIDGLDFDFDNGFRIG